MAWFVFGPTTQKPAGGYFYISSGADFESVKKELLEQGVLRHTSFFNVVAKSIGYYDHIRPGRFQIPEGTSIFSLVRMLKSGRQAEIRLVINKVRTKEDFASLIGRHHFEASSNDALRFLNDNAKLRPLGYDTNDIMTVIIPNSYLLYWNGDFEKIFNKLKKEHDLFWEGKRQHKAEALGFSSKEIYIIASIVEEETTKAEDKPRIASVYFNRLKKGMKLEADPTVKFAMRQFQLTRILHEHLSYASPYNTYYVKGLPPGPICTPSIATIDAVLNAPETNDLFFVAKPDFSGYSNFAATYEEHLQNAHAYQKALNELESRTPKPQRP